MIKRYLSLLTVIFILAGTIPTFTFALPIDDCPPNSRFCPGTNMSPPSRPILPPDMLFPPGMLPELILPPFHYATLTSKIGTVSTDDTANETISNVPYGTTLAELKAAITLKANATFEVYDADGTTVATTLATGTKVIVTAQDIIASVTYIVTVNTEFSSVATLTSVIGTVSKGGKTNETIANIPNGTSLTELKDAITPAANATYEIYDADGTTVATTLATGKKVIVTAQDGTARVTYTVTVIAPLSTVATLTTKIGTVSTGGTANETITDIPNRTTLAALKDAITPAANAKFEVYDADGMKIATTLQTDKKVVVTAQDGTTRVTYTVTVNAALSNAATLSSTIGIVSTGRMGNESIANLPNGTTLAALKAAITPAANAKFEVYDADGMTVATTLTTGKRVIVTAQDGTTKVTYIVTIDVADPLDNWRLLNPSPSSEFMSSVAYGNGTFVAVGHNQTILTSSDGASWTSRKSPYRDGPPWSYDITGVKYENGIFMTVQLGGTIMTSSDGVDWKILMSDSSVELHDITYGNGTFVAVGTSGTGAGKATILTSSDEGASWTSSTWDNTSMLSINYVNGIFMASGSGGTIVTSSDGVNWTKRSVSTKYISSLSGVAYGSGKYVTVGSYYGIFTSIDGVKWTQQETQLDDRYHYADVLYSNGTFMVLGENGRILTSSNGESWARRTSGTSKNISDAAYGNGTYVVVGDGMILQNASILSSNAKYLNLDDLTLSSGGLSPAFASGTTSYTAIVDNDVSSIQVTPTLDSIATVTVNGTKVASRTASEEISLNVGMNKITVVTTFTSVQYGTTEKSYTVMVMRDTKDPSTKLYINGTLQASPTMVNGNAMVPARMVSEQLGASVDWYPDAKFVLIIRNGIEIRIYIGNEVASVVDRNFQRLLEERGKDFPISAISKDIKLPEKPLIDENGAALVPLRFIFETLGAYVEFIDATNTINVSQ